MKSKNLYYYLAVVMLAMLPLVGCSGSSGSSVTPNADGTSTFKIVGQVELDKSVAKSVGLGAGAIGKVEVFNAYSTANKAALATVDVAADGSFKDLNFTLPGVQSVVKFKATLTGPPETLLYNVTPMDLTVPSTGAGLTNNNVLISISNASTATASAALKAQGADLEKLISNTKAFADVAASVVAKGGYVLSYSSNGIKLGGTLDGAANVPMTNVESCSTCHSTAGVDHQALYKSAMNTTALTAQITNVTVGAVDANGKYPTTATFTLAFNGAPYDIAVTGTKLATGTGGVEKTTYYATLYDSATRTFSNAGSMSTIAKTGVATYTATGLLTADMNNSNGFIYMYFTKDPAGIAATGNVVLYKYVCNIAKKFGTVDYQTYAPVAGCQKCHPTPYLKHGYRAADVQGGTIPTMAPCKACHYDGRKGNDAAEFFGDAAYVYTANVMTDVHASHNNFLPYPQSMANCVTCHIGENLALALSDANFKQSVCETCHATTAGTLVKKPLASVVPHPIPADGICNSCHKAGGMAPTFIQIHAGMDKVKYADATKASSGTLRYTYFIDSIVKNGTNLTIVWGAKDASGVAVDVLNLDAAKGPVFLGLPADRNLESEGVRIMVGYYGLGTNTIANYDNITKNAIIASTTFDAAAGKATTVFPLSNKLTTYGATKLEVGIIGVPQVNGSMVAVKSETKGINLSDGSLADPPIIADNAKCNTCHDNIVMHIGDSHGHTTVGNVNACKFCHNPSSPSGHYAQQSRSIDSYLHGIHAFPTETEFVFPMFTPLNCEACHAPGTYNVPDQTKSLGGVINAGSSASVTVGPGSKSCASCHRALNIRNGGGVTADAVAVNASLNAHTQTFGYRISTIVAAFADVINKAFSLLH